jgi:2'-5' RNA ligase
VSGASPPTPSRPGPSRPAGAAGSSRSPAAAGPSGSPAAAGSSRSPAAAGSSRSPAAAGPSLRLFVALEFPAAARAALAAFRDAAADPEVWRPLADEAIHLTLAFLGHRPAEDVATIEPVLHAAAGPAPRLALGGALLLPPRRARVLCADLDDPDDTLAALQSRVGDGLAAAGVYTPEKRPFRTHATVARLRPRALAPRSVDAAPEPLEFAGEALTLFVSRLHPHGARYEPLVRVNLH